MASTGHCPKAICHGVNVASAKMPHFNVVRRIRTGERIAVVLIRMEVVRTRHEEIVVVDVYIRGVIEYAGVDWSRCGVKVVLRWLAFCLSTER
jgi:hypothetical protein